MMTLLSTYYVSHGYQRFSLLGKKPYQPVLKEINIHLYPNESAALLGNSGCGKSTLARMLCGLEIPKEGEIIFEGRTTKQMNRTQRQAMHRDIQMVLQDSVSAVNPRKTVASIIQEPLKYLTSMSKSERMDRTIQLLNQVGLPDSMLNKRPPQISGGQLQRVCIARALASKPKLIILDEALSNLDLVLQIKMVDMLKEIQHQTGIAWLLITHDIRLAKQFCQRILVMNNGSIVEEADMKADLCFLHPAAQELEDAILPPLPAILTE
ncbi:nickel import ATP-binding protein NikE [Vibrio nitrifigilis]|nr:nickel import ATP-binding protein NikE [Vibrio nitrifigilis]